MRHGQVKRGLAHLYRNNKQEADKKLSALTDLEGVGNADNLSGGYTDRMAIHFAVEEVADDYYGSEKGNEIFVFGSNEAGRHGAGAAAQAKRWGAKNGIGVGLSGHTYAIPTKDKYIETLGLSRIP